MAWNTNDIPDQSGKVAVITGANSGLGFEATRELARQGATVVMAVCNTDKGETAVAAIKRRNPQKPAAASLEPPTEVLAAANGNGEVS